MFEFCEFFSNFQISNEEYVNYISMESAMANARQANAAIFTKQWQWWLRNLTVRRWTSTADTAWP
jgi:hypothetical protein